MRGEDGGKRNAAQLDGDAERTLAKSVAALARALNGDEVGAGSAAAAPAKIGNAPGDLLAIGLSEGDGLRVLAASAEGGCGRRSALRAAGEATIDAVAVGIVGDDEDPLFCLRGGKGGDDRAKDRDGKQGTHRPARLDTRPERWQQNGKGGVNLAPRLP